MDLTQSAANAKTVALHEIAERCKRDLFFLVKEVLAINSELITEHTHRELCEMTRPLLPNYDPVTEAPHVNIKIRYKKDGEVDPILSDQFDPRRNKLHVEMPRGTFKSSIVTVGFALQFFLNDPDARILIDTETYSKSKNFLAEIKGHLEDNQKYRAIFFSIHGCFPDDGKKNSSTRWTDSMVDLACRKNKRKEPSIMCSGIDKSINGMHFDLIIMDDLHSEKNVTNKEQIEQVIDHYKLAFSLLDPGCPAIVIGTRWDYQDLYQYILENERYRYNIIIRSAIEDDELLFPERLTPEFLEEQKRVQGNYIYSCNPGYSPVLMADYSIKRIDEIKVGDEIMGFEIGADGGKSKLVPTAVKEVNSRLAETQIVQLDSGRILRCTPDHHWFTGRNDGTHKPYKPVTLGSKMFEVLDTDDHLHPVWGDDTERINAYQYLAGMIDGEGACKHGSINISQSEEYNAPVCKKIRDTLDILELPYKIGKDHVVINGGRQSKFDILRYGSPAKAPQIISTLNKYPGMPAKRKSKVVDIRPFGEEKVYALTTTTGNYVVHGMMSKNCQYMNNPVDDETATFRQSYFRHTSWDLVKDRPINWYITIDPSMEGPYSDYAAFVLAGMDYQQELYVRQVHRAKMNYSEIINLMFDWYLKYKPRSMALETIATQKNIQYMLNNEQKNRGIWLPVKEIKSRTASKESRIEALAPYYEFGRVHHINDGNQISELEYELLHFPKGSHDDVIDALATVLEIASPPTGKRVSGKERERSKTRYNDKPRSPVTGI